METQEDAERWDALPSSVSDDPGCGIAIMPLTRSAEPLHFSLGGGRELVIQHEPSAGLSQQIWPAASRLAHHALASPAAWRGKSVLELGSGTGFGGLAFAALGAHVLLTDLPKCMAVLEANKAHNAAVLALAGGSASCCVLEWGVTPLADLPAQWQHPDLVVAADVIYSTALVQPLLHTVKQLVHGDTSLLLSKVKRWATDKAFLKRAAKHFDVVELDAPQQSEHPRLYRLRRKQNAADAGALN